jgi:hypothetical protein
VCLLSQIRRFRESVVAADAAVAMTDGDAAAATKPDLEEGELDADAEARKKDMLLLPHILTEPCNGFRCGGFALTVAVVESRLGVAVG